MSIQTTFKRYELKYLLTVSQYQKLCSLMEEYMTLDEFGKNTINNIYFDTPDYLLIRRSLEKPCYKEKLRVRTYGTYSEEKTAFVEMKKKYHGVVYKRRLPLSQQEAFDFLLKDCPLQHETQITKELTYFMHYYHDLQPAVALFYEREAFYGSIDHDFRMTFDHNIRINLNSASFHEDDSSKLVIPKDSILLEVKTSRGLPSWLLSFFSSEHIYKTSFSKYGTAYKKYILPQQQGGKSYVA
ncbi:MAG: polyphosphate polymerase domain-containing protein [Eubacteriales bacterium]